jgi:hypothetical protein
MPRTVREPRQWRVSVLGLWSDRFRAVITPSEAQQGGSSVTNVVGSVCRAVVPLLTVVALAAGCASSGPGRSSNSPVSPGAGTAMSQSTPSPNVDPETVHRLWLVASNGVRDSGGGTVLRAEAVETTHTAAMKVTDAGGGDDERVWVVEVERTKPRVCDGGSCPNGGSGRYQLFVIRATTFQQTDYQISSKATDLSRLGSVVTLHD